MLPINVLISAILQAIQEHNADHPDEPISRDVASKVIEAIQSRDSEPSNAPPSNAPAVEQVVGQLQSA